MPFLRRNTAPSPTLPIHNGPSRVASYLDWMTTASSVIWTERDEWKKQYKIVKYSASEHNKPFIEVLAERSGWDCQEISNFMDQRSSPRGEYEAQRVEAFCKGAEGLLGPGVPNRDQQLMNDEEPRAWVSDRNYWLLKDDPTTTFRHGNVLGRIDFYNILQKERYRESLSGDMVGPIRHLFVSNPDGASVLAILKTANEFQVPALHELLANYITTDPNPSISLEVSDLWNTSYVISFTLPFYAIGLGGREDKRTLHDKEQFRARYDLEYFSKEELRSILTDTRHLNLQEKLVLHQGVYSFSATGVTEEHWTAYCFDDEFFESEPRILEDEGEMQSPEEYLDPILDEVDVGDTATQWRPRQYSLVALAKRIDKVHGHHTLVHAVFKHSLDSYAHSIRNGPNSNHSHSNEQAWKRYPGLLSKVIFCNNKNIKEIEGFLKHDIQLDQAGVPQGMLWQSLRSDIKAIKALRAITKNLKKLKRVGDKLEEIQSSFKGLRHERELECADQQKTRDERAKEFVIVMVVFAILTLIAEVYSGKPQKGDEASQPGYIFLVASFSFICIAGILYMLRIHIAEYMKKAKGFIKTKRSALRNSQVVVMLIKFACHIYSRLTSLFRILRRCWRREGSVLPI
ncbi:hypothetical protein LB507_004501 [Fusarium sp. FIESC RH6]|nr:hypothetical protein LB507_004501 [Fusarium sp. FIESC RH6]